MLLCILLGEESCYVYQSVYHAGSGYYYIDVDGYENGEESFEVYCDMSRTPPLTKLDSNGRCGYTVKHVQTEELDVGYNTTEEAVHKLIKASSMS